MWLLYVASGALVMVAGPCAHAEVYTVQNPMPVFRNAQLNAIAQGLYEVYKKSGSREQGMKALLNTHVWEPWAAPGAPAIMAVKEAVTHPSLTGSRDEALMHIVSISYAFMQAAQAGKGNKKLLEEVQEADARLQAELGPNFANPCNVRAGAVGSCGDDDAFDLQEQWSLLKVCALTYAHFVRTMHPFMQEEPTGWDAVRSFEQSLLTLNTSCFTSGLDIRERFSTDEIAQHLKRVRGVSPEPHDIATYIAMVNGNLLLALPRMAANERAAVAKLLSAMQEFIGTDDAKLAQDTRNIIIYWHILMMGMSQSFDALKSAEVALQKQHSNVGYKARPDKLDLNIITWAQEPLSPHVVDIFRSWLGGMQYELASLLASHEWAEKFCFFDSSRQKYAVLLLMIRYLDIFAQKVGKSLQGLEQRDNYYVSSRKTTANLAS